MLILSIIFFILLIKKGIKLSKKKQLYLFSPIIVVHFSFLMIELIPYLNMKYLLQYDVSRFEKDFIYYMLINILFLSFVNIYDSKWQINKVKVRDFVSFNLTLVIRFLLYSSPFLLIILIYGLHTKIPIMILKGVDIEGYRRSVEIGKGYLKIGTIPFSIMYLMFMIKYNKRLTVLTVLSLSILLGIINFMCIGHKAIIALYVTYFVVWYTLKYRGLTIYEYLGFYFAQPFVASFLQALRGADLSKFVTGIGVYFTYPTIIYRWNCFPVLDYVYTKGINFWGAEYVPEIVQFIPRAIWSSKPLSFDYFYKEIAGLEFEGGGVYLSFISSCIANFGYLGPIVYLTMVLIVYKVYNKLMSLENSDGIQFFLYLFALLNMLPNPVKFFRGGNNLLLFFAIIVLYNLFYSKFTYSSKLKSIFKI